MRISDLSSDVCSSDLCCLLVDVDVLHPLRLPPRTDTAVVWSRPAAMAVADLARRIEVRADSPRFLPGPPDEEILDSFVRDLFRSEEHTSELQSLMRISYAVFCLKKKRKIHTNLQ